MSAIGNRISKECMNAGVKVEYAFQELTSIPNGYTVPDGRTKPWGTGQAVLAAKELIDEPFVVINADDYYGKNAFISLYNHLKTSNGANTEVPQCCMAGFRLRNTLSDNGGVTRGICSVSEDFWLNDIVETKNIVKKVNVAGVLAESDGTVIDIDSYVSMNMWGFTPDFVTMLESGFDLFFENDINSNPLSAEYLLPIFIGEQLHKNNLSVKVIPTNDEWFGVTYQEDKEAVIANFKKLILDGIYSEQLYDDL